MARGHPDWQPWTAVQRFAGTGGATPFELLVTTASGVTALVPDETDMPLVKGFISHVWLRFPQGSSGLMGVSLWDHVADGGVQLWPGTADTWFTGDNEVIEFDTEYDVPLDGQGLSTAYHDLLTARWEWSSALG